jgi:hypothetical protein
MGKKLEYPPNDDKFEEFTLQRATPYTTTDGKPYWEVLTTESSGLIFPTAEGLDPKPGSIMRLYGRGLGYPVRGVFVDGVKSYYRTQEEDDQYREDERRKQDEREEAKHMLRGRADDDYKLAKLPSVFQERIRAFRARNPKFFHFEGYELFTCEQAVKIAGMEYFAAARNSGDRQQISDALKAFMDLPWEQQHAAGLDGGHSGNTFGVACTLAYLYMTQPELIPKAHGAMCALAGCEDYGCWASTAEAQAEREKAEQHDH